MTPEARIVDTFLRHKIKVPSELKPLLSKLRRQYDCALIGYAPSRYILATGASRQVGVIEISSPSMLPATVVDTLTVHNFLCRREAAVRGNKSASPEKWHWDSDMPWVSEWPMIYHGQKALEMWVQAANPSLREYMTVKMVMESGEDLSLSIRIYNTETHHVYIELRPKKKENIESMRDLVPKVRGLGTWNEYGGVFWRRYLLPEEGT